MTGPGGKGEPTAYRPCVGVMLINRNGLVWVGRRVDTPDGWQMPQGGIDPGETPEAAALRELAEEIGTTRAVFLGETQQWLTYDLPAHLIGKVWQGRYRGQKQKWFACRFLGDDGEIDIHGVDHPEFDAWKWVSVDHLVQLIVPFKRRVYAELVGELARYARPAPGQPNG